MIAEVKQMEFDSRTDRRMNKGERRKKPLHRMFWSVVAGKRKTNRRATDPQNNYYVDVYSAHLLTALLLIVVLSLLDAIFTYAFVSRGGKELNPIMDVMLQQGALAFFPYKFFLTSIGVFILCLHKNFYFVRMVISLILILYILLTFYHVGIIYAF